jgi:hypothetical protein
VAQRLTDVAAWPEMRSKYAWLPHDGVTLTGAHQVGVSFSEHRGAVVELASRVSQIHVPAGARVRDATDAVDLSPDPECVRMLSCIW